MVYADNDAGDFLDLADRCERRSHGHGNSGDRETLMEAAVAIRALVHVLQPTQHVHAEQPQQQNQEHNDQHDVDHRDGEIGDSGGAGDAVDSPINQAEHHDENQSGDDRGERQSESHTDAPSLPTDPNPLPSEDVSSVMPAATQPASPSRAKSKPAQKKK